MGEGLLTDAVPDTPYYRRNKNPPSPLARGAKSRRRASDLQWHHEEAGTHSCLASSPSKAVMLWVPAFEGQVKSWLALKYHKAISALIAKPSCYCLYCSQSGLSGCQGGTPPGIMCLHSPTHPGPCGQSPGQVSRALPIPGKDGSWDPGQIDHQTQEVQEP